MKRPSLMPAEARRMTGRPRCRDCRRPLTACWCSYVRVVETPHRVVVLQHPKEARHALGTVQIVRRVLPTTRVHIGTIFPVDGDLAASLSDRQRTTMFLNPVLAGRVASEWIDASSRIAGPLTFVVVDGTWRQAASIVKRNTWFDELTPLCLVPSDRSRYLVRSHPASWALSTVEAVAEAMRMVGGAADVADALLRPLDAMVGMHLACEDTGSADVLGDRQSLLRSGYLPPL
jgi:tRNA-uridine aminocarboxypropyltransferase